MDDINIDDFEMVYKKKDCIKIEEFNMFLNSNLKCKQVEISDDKSFQIGFLKDFHSNSYGPSWGFEDGNGEYVMHVFNGLERVIPFVKPLKKAKKADLLKLLEGKKSSFQLMCKLASENYDVFNWLGRRLAVELKED